MIMTRFFDFCTANTYPTFTVDEGLSELKKMFTESDLDDYAYDESSVVDSIKTLITLKGLLKDGQVALIRVFYDTDKKQIFTTPATMIQYK